MATNTYGIIDKAALAISAAAMLIGIVVLGIVEILAGKPFGAAPLTNDAGEVIATPAVDPALRTGLVLLGFLVLLGWGLYRMFEGPAEEVETQETTVTAD